MVHGRSSPTLRCFSRTHGGQARVTGHPKLGESALRRTDKETGRHPLTWS